VRAEAGCRSLNLGGGMPGNLMPPGDGAGRWSSRWGGGFPRRCPVRACAAVAVVPGGGPVAVVPAGRRVSLRLWWIVPIGREPRRGAVPSARDCDIKSLHAGGAIAQAPVGRCAPGRWAQQTRNAGTRRQLMERSHQYIVHSERVRDDIGAIGGCIRVDRAVPASDIHFLSACPSFSLKSGWCDRHPDKHRSRSRMPRKMLDTSVCPKGGTARRRGGIRSGQRNGSSRSSLT